MRSASTTRAPLLATDRVAPRAPPRARDTGCAAHPLHAPPRARPKAWSGQDGQRAAFASRVVASCAVAGDIDRHIRESAPLAGRDDRVACLECLDDLARGDFDACDRSLARKGHGFTRMPSDADLPNA